MTRQGSCCATAAGNCLRESFLRNWTSPVRWAPWTWKTAFARSTPIIMSFLSPSSFSRGVEYHTLGTFRCRLGRAATTPSRPQHAPPRPTGSPQPEPGVTNGRTGTKIALRIAKNDPEPKVHDAKWAANHKNQGNTRSTEGRYRASGGTCYAVAAKTVKNRGARLKIALNQWPTMLTSRRFTIPSGIFSMSPAPAPAIIFF